MRWQRHSLDAEVALQDLHDFREPHVQPPWQGVVELVEEVRDRAPEVLALDLLESHAEMDSGSFLEAF